MKVFLAPWKTLFRICFILKTWFDLCMINKVYDLKRKKITEFTFYSYIKALLKVASRIKEYQKPLFTSVEKCATPSYE